VRVSVLVPASRKTLTFLTVAGLVVGCALLTRSAPSLPSYVKTVTLGQGKEWRFRPLVVDLNRDGRLDLVATARLAKPSLHIWMGDSKATFTEIAPTWTSIGYGALATGDINGDGFPDIVAASHFEKVQTLLSDGKGRFTEKILPREDGYVAAQLADLKGDGHLDLILLGNERAGIEIYSGDGTGTWKLDATLPEPRPGQTMPGRSLVVTDLNHDGHLDLIAAFQRWGTYIYYGDGQGGFTGGPVDFHSEIRDIQSIAVADVNHDGHLDVAFNGTFFGWDKPKGPEVYLSDGHGGWKNSSAGLKVLKLGSPGIALGDLDGDGNIDIVAGGSLTGDINDGYGLFWFRGDGKGGWHLVQESGLPTHGLPVIHSITLADLDGDGALEIVVLTGTPSGSITIWKRRSLE
jgi:FG-GAP-like repeat